MITCCARIYHPEKLPLQTGNKKERSWGNVSAGRKEEEMTEVSYSAHISNGKSAITNKGKLSGVAKHNLRKYRSKGYDRENIVLLCGSANLMQDVKKIYQETFSEALEQYNNKQTRADRRIGDYFEHVSGKNQDMAVEIIFQCGDKEFWENISSSGNGERSGRNNACEVYRGILERLQKEMTDFKVANAVVHFDEASPHMHVVGVPVGRGFKRGLETKVSKRSVFSPWSLENVLQGSLREEAEMQMKLHYGVFLKEKQKGKNHDLTVTENKVQKETKRLERVEEDLSEKEDQIYIADLQLSYRENEISKAERLLSDVKQELAGAEKDLEQIKAESRETRLNATKELQSIWDRYDRMQDNFDRLKEKQEGLLADIHTLDIEVEKRSDFLYVLGRLREVIEKLLSMIPIVKEFVRLVEEKRDIKAATSYSYTALGRLLKEHRTPLQGRFVIFPEIASWQTSQGEVIPIYEDFNGRGVSYTLVGFWNLRTKSTIRISEIHDEIAPENRICTLEQAAVYVKAVENFMEDMRQGEEQQDEFMKRQDYPVYRTERGEKDWER